MSETTYPSIPNVDGFYYESESDKEQSIETKFYDNGNKVKQAVLVSCGKTAVVRELLAKDTKDITRFMDKDPEKYQMAAIVVAVTLNGEKQAFEVIEQLKMKDYNKLLSMYQDLNF